MPKRAPTSQATPKEKTGTAAKSGLSLLPHVSQAEMELILSQWRTTSPYYFKTTSEKEKELFTEYLKFMVIKVKTKSAVCPSQQIDHIWHSHIICTREYAAFCARIDGNGQFLHHAPSDGITSQQIQYANTVQRYSELGFGSIADHPDCWEPSSSVSAFVNPVRPGKKARLEEDVPAKAPSRVAARRSTAPAPAAVHVAIACKAVRRSAPAPAAVPAARSYIAVRKTAPTPAAVPAASSYKAVRKTLADTKSDETEEPTPLEDRPLYKQTEFPVKAPLDPTRPVRHLRTVVDLVKEGILFALKPYSKKQENGLYRFTTKKINAIYGPGSNRNGLYHCRRCDCLWHYEQDHAKDNSYKTFDAAKWAKDHNENDQDDQSEDEDDEEEDGAVVLSDDDESEQEDDDLLNERKYCVYCGYKCSKPYVRPTIVISCRGCG